MPKIPSAKQRSEKIVTHGHARVDEYSWLRDEKDPAVMEYVTAENRYADAILKPLKKLQKQLYSEIRSRITEDDVSVPVKDGPYLYYGRMKKGKQYAIHCRKLAKKGKEEVILDENQLAKGHQFFSLGDTDMHPDHTKLVYTVDTTGNERFRLHIKDLQSGENLSDTIDSVSAVVWSEDGDYIFYTKEEHPFPPRKVYRHRIGTPAQDDVLIFEEKDPQWYVNIQKTRSKKYLFISVGNFDSSEVWFLPADRPLDQPKLVAHRQKKVKYSLEHWGDKFFIISNERAVNYKIMQTSCEKYEKKFWRPWVPYNPKHSIVDFAAYKDFFAVEMRVGGSPWVYVCATDSNKLKKIALPEDEHSVGLVHSLEFESPVVRFAYSSFLTPRSTYEYNVEKNELILRKRQRAPRWDPTKYVSERVWVKSGDARVPISLCYKKGLQKNGRAPLLLEAYGSYGITHDPYYSVARIPLLERGCIIAIAHPRGGGEMGWSWHEEAKLLTKHRTYEDVIACADFLVKKRYCARDKLALTGGSAGGMTLGAVLNMRPDVCGTALVYVPNSDTVTSMLDPTLGGTILHYDELGDPRQKKFYDYFLKWSPYENVKQAAYPAILVRASLHDIRTPYWEAAKWVARLRARKTDENRLLFKVEMHAGHAGKSGRYEWITEKAFDYAFLLMTFGLHHE
ncbi:MAG: hypothetical protein RIQ56_517 [Candidatus Parcubacteria bacterium]|jgi:oligopeptidase B